MKRATAIAFNDISLALTILGALLVAQAESSDDSLAPWRSGVQVRAVSPQAEGHTIHSYFNTCPESPDGRRIVYFASTTADGHHGEIRIRHRATGTEKVLARDIHVEDAHRVACQQWVSNGRRVVFHGERNGQWIVTAVDVDSGHIRDLALGRLAGWGQPNGDLVPLYGPHWNPRSHRDLELLNVETGEIRTVLTMDAVQAAYHDAIANAFGDKPVSIFFPVLSPDSQRVFFKLATPAGGDARSTAASTRLGLVCYSLAEQRPLYMNPRWGHPSWHPDSRTIVESRFSLFDSNDGSSRRISGLPAPRGDHPSASPDGKLIVTDTTMDVFGGDPKQWGVVVADTRGAGFVLLHQFDNSHGASSWRRSHPHPVFSPDGRRIYFNVSSGPWTQLFVAELAGASPIAAASPESKSTTETLVVGHKWDDSVGFYDSTSGAVRQTVPIGKKPHEMAQSRDGKLAYLTLYGIDQYIEQGEGGRAVAILDLQKRSKLGEIDLGKYRRPHGIEVGHLSGRLYVTCDHPPALLVLDPDKRAIEAAIDLADARSLPHMVAVTPDEKSAFVANSGTGDVSMVDLESRQEVKRIGVGGVPMGLALGPDGKRLFVATRTSNGVAVIDADQRKVVRIIEISGQPVRVHLTPDGRWLLVTLIDSGELAVVDAQELTLHRRLAMGQRVEGLTVDPAGHFGYASVQAENKVVKFSLGDWKPVLEIKTGQRPDPLIVLPSK